MSDSALYVRVESDPEASPPDEAAVRARVERLRTSIGLAMTLE